MSQPEQEVHRGGAALTRVGPEGPAERIAPDHAAPEAEPVDEDPTRVVLRRYGKYVLQSAILMVLILFMLLVMLVLTAVIIGRPGVEGLAIWVWAGTLMVVLWSLSWWFEVWLPYRRGTNPLMRLFGLRVVTEQGGPPTLRAYTVRWLLMIVDGTLYGLVGAAVMAVSPRHQRFGDMVARTLVVRAGAVRDGVLIRPARSPRPRWRSRCGCGRSTCAGRRPGGS